MDDEEVNKYRCWNVFNTKGFERVYVVPEIAREDMLIKFPKAVSVHHVITDDNNGIK